MRDPGQLYFATNKEIHDLLYSAKQKITESVLHELLRDRGIIGSPKESRERLAEYLSMLPHDYSDVCGILERREVKGRAEKTSSMTLKVALSAQDLKEVVADYGKEETKEEVRSFKKSEDTFVMDVTYPEYDYSRTRLLQRQDRDASITFVQKDGLTEVRFPATEKSRTIVEKLKQRIEQKKKQVVDTEEIELSKLQTPEERTNFFTTLITSLPNFTLVTVSRLRVASPKLKDDDIEGDEDDLSEAEEVMLGVVKNVALTGENLEASPLYQQLKEKGFFITSITWRAKQSVSPYTIIECDAGFEDGLEGRNFRYSIRGALRFKNTAYAKTLKAVEGAEREGILNLMEKAARSVLNSLIEAAEAKTAAGGA